MVKKKKVVKKKVKKKVKVVKKDVSSKKEALVLPDKKGDVGMVP